MKRGTPGRLPASVKEFLAELEDLLEELGRDLMFLEDVLRNGGEDPDLINSIFRSFHTIKGLAGMLSLEEIGTLAHALEDLLDSIRLGRVSLGDGVLEILAKGIELLGVQAKAVGSGAKVPGVKEFIGTIQEGVEMRAAESEQVITAESADLSEDFVRTLTEYEEHRLRENMRHGRNLIVVHRSFSLEAFDEELNDLLGRLKKSGEVISTLPNPAEEDPSRIKFDLLWATNLSLEDAAKLFSLEPSNLSTVDYRREAPERETLSSSLRSLSQTVRVDIKRLDNLMSIVGELVIYKTHLNEMGRQFLAREGMTPVSMGLTKAVKALDRTLDLLQKGVIDTRMVPIGQMFGKLHRIVRKLGRDMGKEIDLKISGEDTELDKLVIEDMADPLLHLVRNAVDHGIESPGEREQAGKPPRGTIRLSAFQKGNHIVMEIEDDGRGIDVEEVRRTAQEKGLLDADAADDGQHLLSFLFVPGFSTRKTANEISGRGVGMDVVKNNVSRLRGMIDVSSELGKGTKVTVTLPMTLAIIQALMVRAGEEIYAVPIGSVVESVQISPSEIRKVESKEMLKLRDGILPLLRLQEFFGLQPSPLASAKDGRLYVVVVGLAEKRLGLVVDGLRGQQEIVIKTLGEILKPVRGIAGATELGDRRAVLVLDVSGLIQEATFSI